jgi:asparagine synthase (glutamine-hydrolysing)
LLAFATDDTPVKCFLCLLDAEGRGGADTMRRRCQIVPRSRRLTAPWQLVGDIPVVLDGEIADPHELVACHGDYVAFGSARLDHRDELERTVGLRRSGLTDLALILHTVVKRGPGCLSRVIGDFGIVVWNTATHSGVAASDPFAVKKLFYAARAGVLAFASRSDLLGLDERYDAQYLAELVALCVPAPGLTVHHGVRSIPAGTVATLVGDRVTMRRYWAASDFAGDSTLTLPEPEAVETCRGLIAEAVRSRLAGAADTWAQLSGGLDSSSVVGIAQWLAARGHTRDGLAGTITYVDSRGTGGDEREYSDAVLRHWPLRNEVIVDAPTWWDDGYAPPQLDQPGPDLLFYPREARLSEIVRAAGGRVLLTGVGGDNLFTGNMFFFADWLAEGRILEAATEMARRAALGRVSFWELAYRNAILPFLPDLVRTRLLRDEAQMPPWILPSTARRYGLPARATAAAIYAGRRGNKYRDGVAASVAAIVGGLSYAVIEEALDVRHPYLYRPLVEFALRLPPTSCVRPHQRKWILREAMRGILPEPVRTRVGKGGPQGGLAWSLVRQKPLLEPLLRDQVLAELGVVDPVKLRASFEALPHEPDGREKLHAAVHHTLAIEAWLQMRSGRWPASASTAVRRSATSVN